MWACPPGEPVASYAPIDGKCSRCQADADEAAVFCMVCSLRLRSEPDVIWLARDYGFARLGGLHLDEVVAWLAVHPQQTASRAELAKLVADSKPSGDEEIAEAVYWGQRAMFMRHLTEEAEHRARAARARCLAAGVSDAKLGHALQQARAAGGGAFMFLYSESGYDFDGDGDGGLFGALSRSDNNDVSGGLLDGLADLFG